MQRQLSNSSFIHISMLKDDFSSYVAHALLSCIQACSKKTLNLTFLSDVPEGTSLIWSKHSLVFMPRTYYICVAFKSMTLTVFTCMPVSMAMSLCNKAIFQGQDITLHIKHNYEHNLVQYRTKLCAQLFSIPI